MLVWKERVFESLNNQNIALLLVVTERAVADKMPSFAQLVPPGLSVVQAVDVGDEGHLGDKT